MHIHFGNSRTQSFVSHGDRLNRGWMPVDERQHPQSGDILLIRNCVFPSQLLKARELLFPHQTSCLHGAAIDWQVPLQRSGEVLRRATYGFDVEVAKQLQHLRIAVGLLDRCREAIDDRTRCSRWCKSGCVRD